MVSFIGPPDRSYYTSSIGGDQSILDDVSEVTGASFHHLFNPTPIRLSLPTPYSPHSQFFPPPNRQRDHLKSTIFFIDLLFSRPLLVLFEG